MSRNERPRYVHDTVWQDGFDEQVYRALRRSPWWMISLAIHVLVFLVASLLVEEDRPGTATDGLRVVASSAEDLLDERPETMEPTEDVRAHETPVERPLLEQPLEMDDQIRTDDDLPYDEVLGRTDGLTLSDVGGPSNNALIGLGPGGASAFRGRGSNRETGPGEGGGGRARERALEDALRWLAAHQSPSGAWEAAGFDRWCDGLPFEDGPDGRGKALYDPGVTGLALCAFLGAGYTNRGRHPFSRVVSRGLRYLKSVQDPEGCYGPRSGQHFIYNHACAALAMVEAYGMTGSPIFKGSAQKALDFISLSRNPYFAWRYGVRPGENDTSVTGWMMMALKSARLVNEDALARGRPPLLAVDEEAFDGIRAWVDKMTDPDTGRVGYLARGSGPARPYEMIDRFPNAKSESMTAVGVLARIFIGQDRRDPAIQKGAALCAGLPPRWDEQDGSIDMYYWYYATLALFQVGGAPWRTWNDAMQGAIVERQRQDTDYCRYKGSWDPVGPWGPDGGRVYATALLAMCLEVYYRYPRVFVGAR